MRLSHLLKKYGNSAEARTVLMYTFANFFNKGVAFLLLFYFTHVLSQSDFGLLSLFNNSILLLMPFISLGVLQSVNADFFKLDKSAFRDYFSTTLLMPIGVAVLAILVLWLFKTPLQERYHFPTYFIALLPIVTLFNFLNEHLTNMVRNNQEPWRYVVVSIGRLLIEIALAVWFISGIKMGWLGRVMGFSVSYMLVALYAFWYFYQKRYLFGRLNKHLIKEELIYSIPVMVMQASVFCMFSSSGYFIEYFQHNFEEVGTYSVAATFASIIMVLCGALLQYVYPRIYAILSEPKPDVRALKKLFLFYAGSMLGGTIFVLIATPLAYQWILKPVYHPGLNYYYWIALGYFCWTIAYFFYAYLLYHKQKRNILGLSLISIVISLASQYLLVKTFGARGAAIAVFGGYLLILIITWLFVGRQIKPILQSTHNPVQPT